MNRLRLPFILVSLFLFPLHLTAQQGGGVPTRTINPHGTSVRETCSACHGPNSWTPARITKEFRHAENTFPLIGAHATATCTSCHTSLNFTTAVKSCANCHSDIHKGELGADCARCHTPRSFTDRATMTRMHQLTRFPLRGGHATVACESCHPATRSGQPQFLRANTTCMSCHATTFRQTTSPPHVEPAFSPNCTVCHTTTTWVGGKFDHALTLFALTGAHTKARCADCHADKVYHGKNMECVSCHQKDYNGTVNPPHSQGFPTTCTTCHNTVRWQDATFDHSQMTRFALTGAHRTLACSSCHGDKTYKGRSMECASCHQGTYDKTTSPKHAPAGFNTACATCHNTTQWRGAPFDHNTATKFALTGAHRAATCAQCHSDDVFRGKSMLCVSCHQTDYNGTKVPPHVAAGFPNTCQSCHQTTQWKGAAFDHNTTKFALTGAHKAALCMDCHADNVFKGKPMACVSCHQADYNGAKTPPHGASGFSTVCQSCHTTVQWQGANFDHNATKFPLTGGHLTATCESCHSDGVFVGKSTACESCHLTKYNATTNPPHKAAGFPTTCVGCHTTKDWVGTPFDHAKTQFPLTGAHKAALCNDCHADGVYKGKPIACVSCHQTEYTNTKTPPHAKSGFSTVCQTCHNTTQWPGAVFDHNKTNFALTGAHLSASCDGCHADGVFKGKPSQCQSCHLTDYNGAVSPNHKTSGFPLTCETCHSTTAWKGAPFDHAKTQFPLTGAHLTATCNDCHSDGVYKGKPMACVSCHQTDYNGTKNPPHAAAGFSTLCQSCHTTVKWQGGTFDHNTTKFPLTGGHVAATCLDCHSDGVYKGKSTVCSTCHMTDYNGTVSPNHKASGFPTTCETCHTTTAWKGAPFDHSKTLFPLTGAHLTATCNDCHSDGVYKGKPTACVSCHQTDYNGTTNPPHAAAGFSTLCQTCHTTTQWKGGKFDHNTTKFPLTGGHLTATCMDCHSDGVYKGKSTVCSTCHMTDYNSTTSPNHKASGFPTTCETCHTTTAWKGAPFDHSKTLFPLTGAHLTATCNDCHSDGVYKGKPTACVSCHQADYNGTKNPPHAAAGFSTLCQTCHTTVKWQGGTFDHSKTLFPLTGAHATATCMDCHSDGVYKGKPTLCISCHQADWNQTTKPNHVQSGFPTTCQTCHTTTQWLGATFNHSTTKFPLTGAHLAATCMDCHSDGVYKGKPTACVSCHQTDYNNTKNPPHAAAGFPTLCDACHTTVKWTGAVFDHSKTLFPLTGAHLTATCMDCHSDGVYKGKPTTCVSCHQTEYNVSTNPHHIQAGFSTLCQSCHTTTKWPGAPYDHTKNTSFPLTGAHIGQQCIACHASKVYNGLATTCVSCHLTDYNNTTNPKHSTSGFPTTCQDCHTTTQWQGATFDHDKAYFPIYSGNHKSEWSRCSDCHVNSSNYQVFECILCHEHSNKSKVDNDHKGKSGYQYKSTSCYSCHPRGN